MANLQLHFEKIAKAITDLPPTPSSKKLISPLEEFQLFTPYNQSEKKRYIILERLGVEYYMEFGNSISGNKTRLVYFFEKFDKNIEKEKKQIEDLKSKQSALLGQLAYSSQTAQKIKYLEIELSKIFNQISIDE